MERREKELHEIIRCTTQDESWFRSQETSTHNIPLYDLEDLSFQDWLRLYRDNQAAALTILNDTIHSDNFSTTAVSIPIRSASSYLEPHTYEDFSLAHFLHHKSIDTNITTLSIYSHIMTPLITHTLNEFKNLKELILFIELYSDTFTKINMPKIETLLIAGTSFAIMNKPEKTKLITNLQNLNSFPNITSLNLRHLRLTNSFLQDIPKRKIKSLRLRLIRKENGYPLPIDLYKNTNQLFISESQDCFINATFKGECQNIRNLKINLSSYKQRLNLKRWEKHPRLHRAKFLVELKFLHDYLNLKELYRVIAINTNCMWIIHICLPRCTQIPYNSLLFRDHDHFKEKLRDEIKRKAEANRHLKIMFLDNTDFKSIHTTLFF